MAPLYFNPQNPLDEKGNRASRPFWMFLDALTHAIQALPAVVGTVTHTGALASNAVVVGNGTDDIKPLASLGTSGQVLVSNGAGTPPSFQSVSASGAIVSYTSAYASPPSSPIAGDIWLPSDGFAAYRYSGSAWVPWGPLFPLTAPDNAAFSWVNQGTATVSASTGSLILTAPGTGTGYNAVCRVKSAPSTPYTITAYMHATLVLKQWPGYGLLFRESSSGKLHTFGVGIFTTGTGLAVRSVKATNATTFSADYTPDIGLDRPLLTQPRWLRIADDGTNRILSLSDDGVNWLVVHSIGRTDFMTADQVGFFAITENAGTPNLGVQLTVMSWAQA